MMKKILKLVSSFFAMAALLSLAVSVAAEEDYKANYTAKVKQNDATIGVIAGVINYVCPKLIPASSVTTICNPEDPVGSAVGIQKYMETNWDKEEDDIDDS